MNDDRIKHLLLGAISWVFEIYQSDNEDIVRILCNWDLSDDEIKLFGFGWADPDTLSDIEKYLYEYRHEFEGV